MKGYLSVQGVQIEEKRLEHPYKELIPHNIMHVNNKCIVLPIQFPIVLSILEKNSTLIKMKNWSCLVQPMFVPSISIVTEFLGLCRCLLKATK